MKYGLVFFFSFFTLGFAKFQNPVSLYDSLKVYRIDYVKQNVEKIENHDLKQMFLNEISYLETGTISEPKTQFFSNKKEEIVLFYLLLGNHYLNQSSGNTSNFAAYKNFTEAYKISQKTGNYSLIKNALERLMFTLRYVNLSQKIFENYYNEYKNLSNNSIDDFYQQWFRLIYNSYESKNPTSKTLFPKTIEHNFIKSASSNPYFLAKAYHILGYYYGNYKDYDKSFTYSEHAKKYYKLLPKNYAEKMIFDVDINIGSFLFDDHKIQESLKVFQKLNNKNIATQRKSLVYFWLKENYTALKKYDSALYYYKKYDENNEEIEKIDNSIKIHDIIIKNNVEEKNQIISKQESQIKKFGSLSKILIGLSMIASLGFILGVIINLRKSKKRLREKQKEEQEKKIKQKEFENQLLQKELERQKSIQKERERISHDMHDDLGAGISALKLQAEFLKQKVQEENIKKDIDDLLKTSEEMNLSMREMLWSLNSGNDNLGNFVQYAGIYAENFFRKTKLKIHIEKTGILPNTLINTETRRNLFLSMKEALNNSYKHSKAENVWVKFIQNEKKFCIEIIDDGVGFPKENKIGNGLYNMQKRMEEIQGSFIVKNTDKGLCLNFIIETE